jgi:ABC-type antimicrobial peptide transport system permease subunit
LTRSVPFDSLTADQVNTSVAANSNDRPGPQLLHEVFRTHIGANYFATVGVPLLRGREFDVRDQRQQEPGRQDVAVPAILNQTAARALFGRENPIGGRIIENEPNYTVVGVTRDIPSGFLTVRPVASMFVPLSAEWFRENPAEHITILLRASATQSTLSSVQNQLASLHPDLTVFDVRTMREDLRRLNSVVEWQAVIYIILGLFALLLACIGVCGVTAYAVARRRKEIGIRMALGARSRQVQALVLREGTVLVTAGSIIGVSGAFVIARVFAAYSETLARIYGQRDDNLLLLFGAALGLVALAMLACYLPARRATDIEPTAALREE